MIGKQIVKQTIMALEDMIDYIEVANNPELRPRLGEIQSLLNFWRLYDSVAPDAEEESAC